MSAVHVRLRLNRETVSHLTPTHYVPQMHNPAQERTLVSNSSEENPTLSAPSVNEFSGEAIIPFNDCETVRNARQRRVARILSTSAPAHRGSPADATEPPPQQRADGLPMEVRKNELTN